MERGEIRWYKFKAPDKQRPVLILTRTSKVLLIIFLRQPIGKDFKKANLQNHSLTINSTPRKSLLFLKHKEEYSHIRQTKKSLSIK